MQTAFRDRSRRLALFGVLSGACGAVGVLLGLFHLALPFVARWLPDPEMVPTDTRSLLMGCLLYCILGVALIIVGVGSVRRRRWVRPIMLMLAWTWLLSGLVGLVTMVGLLDDLVLLSTADLEHPPRGLVLAIQSMIVALSILIGLVLPGAFVWAYQGRDVQRTCERWNPAPAWTDACPTPVLGLAAAMGFAAILGLPLALQPVVPFFGLLITGGSGAVVTVAGSAATGWLGWLIFRLDERAWWSATGLWMLLGASVSVTLLRVGPIEFYRALGYSEPQLRLLAGSAERFGAIGLWGSIAMTVFSVGYMIAIRGHFVPGRAAR